MQTNLTKALMGAARHGQGGGARAPPPGNEQMGICYCYKLYVRVLESCDDSFDHCLLFILLYTFVLVQWFRYNRTRCCCLFFWCTVIVSSGQLNTVLYRLCYGAVLHSMQCMHYNFLLLHFSVTQS